MLLKKNKNTVECDVYLKCEECGSANVIFDENHHEYVCRDCGLVLLDEPLIGDIYTSGGPLSSNHDYWNWHDQPFLDSRGMTSWTSKKKWHIQRKNISLMYIMSQLNMSLDERRMVYYIIDSLKLNQVHSKVNTDICLAGICRYVIKCLHPLRLRQYWYSKGIFKEVGLCKKDYKIIEKNLMIKLR